MRGRYGILLYEDFNLFHVCLASDVDPFTQLTSQDLETVATTIKNWIDHAAHISVDHHLLNQKLVEGSIDFYLSGGIYTASPARRAGHKQVVAVTPTRGPVAGRGGIAFAEVTSVLAQSRQRQMSEQFLAQILTPDIAVRIAQLPGTSNPVVQMADAKVFNSFSTEELDIIQWDYLEHDMERCADYQLMPSHTAVRTLWLDAVQRARKLGKVTD